MNQFKQVKEVGHAKYFPFPNHLDAGGNFRLVSHAFGFRRGKVFLSVN